ncbi:integrase family protein [Rhodobacter sp. KR11]|uniref:tyrosine-type recombinase/integrase n=1 Tax=Rhodobacter sp. KR11 TaxID=2974588 RepID=UPI0022220A07|nr:integrase family protein [Rhodobacter sp. KR11]MCW1918024.1 integrase family protein [Rhodobacter sp. KR11]
MTEKKLTLNDLTLRKLKPTGERFFIADDSVQGLRARVSAQGEAVFVFSGRGADSRSVTVTLGRYPDLSLKAAREEALRQRLALKSGVDVNAKKRQLRETAKATAEVVTLEALVIEYEQKFAPSKKTWQPRGPKSTKGEARMAIERVFAGLLAKDVTKLTEEDFAKVTSSYKRVKSDGTKLTANGQVSRARAYLGPVLDWAAGRKGFAKLGASRVPRIAVANLEQVHDPALDDPTITGKRDRILTEVELRAIVPFLVWPAPDLGDLRIPPDQDFRPIAMRFTLLTAARLEEVCSMQWGHFDRQNKVWFKPSVKTTRGTARSQHLPLSDAAVDVLRSLPGWTTAGPRDLVFPNATGQGALGNWDRFQKKLDIASGTSGWHRHDLRRTAASIMHAMKVPASVIAQIMAHAEPLKHAGVGGATGHYIQLTRVLTNQRDPQEEALDKLAEALEQIASV